MLNWRAIFTKPNIPKMRNKSKKSGNLRTLELSRRTLEMLDTAMKAMDAGQKTEAVDPAVLLSAATERDHPPRDGALGTVVP